MLGDNISRLRKEKGFTQEELAARLNVVRQTVSKWEKGLSVPDAELLVALAETLETDVSVLLGAPVPAPDKSDDVAAQLARINEQLVIKNRRARRIWKTVGIVLIVVAALYILLLVLSIGAFKVLKVDTSEPAIETVVTETFSEPAQSE